MKPAPAVPIVEVVTCLVTEMITAEGPWGSYVCAPLMEGHPLHGHTFGAAGTDAGLIDRWVNERRLPDHMRAAPKASGA